MKLFASICLLILTLNFGCKNQSNIEYEQAVIYQIFPAIKDSIKFEAKPIDVFLYPLAKKDSATIHIDSQYFESIKTLYYQNLSRHNVKREESYIIIMDTVEQLYKSEIEDFTDYYNIDTTEIIKIDNNERYKIDISKLNSSKNNANFVYLSTIENAQKHSESIFSFINKDIISFTRIQFNKSKSYAMLNFTYNGGMYNGNNYRIFLKKENNKWIIDKLESNGCW